jgi:hypothetical protein
VVGWDGWGAVTRGGESVEGLREQFAPGYWRRYDRLGRWIQVMGHIGRYSMRPIHSSASLADQISTRLSMVGATG